MDPLYVVCTIVGLLAGFLAGFAVSLKEIDGLRENLADETAKNRSIIIAAVAAREGVRNLNTGRITREKLLRELWCRCGLEDD